MKKGGKKKMCQIETYYSDTTREEMTLKDILAGASLKTWGSQVKEIDGCIISTVDFRKEALRKYWQKKENEEAVSLINSWMEDTNQEHIADQTKSLAELKKLRKTNRSRS